MTNDPPPDLRLIEDYLPIEAISAEASREKQVRKGHISTRCPKISRPPQRMLGHIEMCTVSSRRTRRWFSSAWRFVGSWFCVARSGTGAVERYYLIVRLAGRVISVAARVRSQNGPGGESKGENLSGTPSDRSADSPRFRQPAPPVEFRTILVKVPSTSAAGHAAPPIFPVPDP